MQSLFIRGAAVVLATVAILLSPSACPSRGCRTTPTGSAGVEILPLEVADHIDDAEGEPPRLLDWDEADPVDLIAVWEPDPWLLAVATPIAGRIARADGKPFLLVASTRPLAKTPLVKGLRVRRCLALASDPGNAIIRGLDGLPCELVCAEAGPTQTALALATRFWGKCDGVVVAALDAPDASILGAALAAHMGMPFVPVDGVHGAPELSAAFQRLGVKRVTAAGDPLDPKLDALVGIGQAVEYLNEAGLTQRTIERLGPERIRNVVLARAAGKEGPSGGSAWLSPYVSLVRGAPIVLSPSEDGLEAQQHVYRFIDGNGLRPRSVTILADHDAIGTIQVSAPDLLGDYEVHVEPCTEPLRGRPCALAVGRIPCSTPSVASLVLAAGFARERGHATDNGRVLMIANPQTAYGVLPLAETIARATTEEFRNNRIGIDAFFGIPADVPPVLAAASKAGLIVYQGHISDQTLFPEPIYTAPVLDGLGDGVPVDETPVEDAPTELGEDPDARADDAEREQAAEPEPFGEPGEPAAIEEPQDDAPADDPEDPYVPPYEHGQEGGPDPAARGDLAGLPLVVLQSCHSLSAPLAERIFDLGGVGFVGSTTSIHSASGGAFIKTFCDGLLYQDDTVGEALRDARNYFLCLADLKVRRGHQQTAKSYRVALSFRLWGDPELKLLTTPRVEPERRAVSARFLSSSKVRISLPARRLSESRTDKYTVRNLPNAQVAGVVRRLKNKPARRLMPFYFFRLPMPEGFAGRKYTRLVDDDDGTPRSAFLVDALGRHVYVLHFPSKDVRRATLTLTFRR
jgi:hypothetical protein